MCLTVLRAGRDQGRPAERGADAESFDRGRHSGSRSATSSGCSRRDSARTPGPILGHIQRGGAPSAFDRHLAARPRGRRAVADRCGSPAQLVGIPRAPGGPAPCWFQMDRPRRRRADQARDLDGRCGCAVAASATRTSILMTMQMADPRPTAPATGGGPAGGGGRRRPRAGHEHRGPWKCATSAWIAAAVLIGQQRLPRAARRRYPGDGLDERQRLGSHLAVPTSAPTRYVPSGGRDRPDRQPVGAHRIGNALLMIGGWAGYQAATSLHPSAPISGTRHSVVCLPAI